MGIYIYVEQPIMRKTNVQMGIFLQLFLTKNSIALVNWSDNEYDKTATAADSSSD